MEIHETGSFFTAVQLKPVFADSKTFPDCFPKQKLELILSDYEKQKDNSDFDLSLFVHENFELPIANASHFKTDTTKSASTHIENLWAVLTRQPQVDVSGSLITLPNPYIVPGGRFGEIYYWDSYFTMLGLKVNGREDLIQNMVDNFTWLIETVGYVPNGNRTYYLGRSQPPFYSLMVGLLSELGGKEILLKYLPSIEKEYAFWMKGSDALTPANNSIHRVVMLEEGVIVNRYWDENCTPRPEAYKEDLELSHESPVDSAELFRHIRAAAESGWDFSSRWFRQAQSFGTIHTTEIIPVDLNCLLWKVEKLMQEGFELKGDSVNAKYYEGLALQRSTAINRYCWSESKGFYFDFDFILKEQTEHHTLASMFPLFFQLATKSQASRVCKLLAAQFLKPGGLTTTLEKTGQQWDAPNGWAPLQWISYMGCKNYGEDQLADAVKSAWIRTNDKVFEATGKMMEKYNVYGSGEAGGGGEYPNQDGFGWTNGVYLAMKENS